MWLVVVLMVVVIGEVGWGRVVGWGGEETPQDLPPEFLLELNTVF